MELLLNMDRFYRDIIIWQAFKVDINAGITATMEYIVTCVEDQSQMSALFSMNPQGAVKAAEMIKWENIP